MKEKEQESFIQIKYEGDHHEIMEKIKKIDGVTFFNVINMDVYNERYYQNKFGEFMYNLFYDEFGNLK